MTAYLSACQTALRWAEAHDYKGYSKFDALNSPLLKKIAGNRFLPRAGFTYLVSRSPVNVRPLLGVEKRQNPKGLALFARAYFNLAQVKGNERLVAHGEQLLELLSTLSQKEQYKAHCWGYCHDWQSSQFFAPAYSPNTVVTVSVAHAFLDGWEQLRKDIYLEIARSTADFIANHLTSIDVDADQYCYSYIPDSQWKVINVNAMIAHLLARLWQHTGEPHLLEISTGIMRWVVAQQTKDGAWYYAVPPESSPITHDNYHTGFVLDDLFMYMNITDDWTWLDAYKQGLSFYQRQLFTDEYAPKWMYDKPFPHDIHGAAQGILTFTLAATQDKSSLQQAHHIANWTLENMWEGKNGRFYYQKHPHFIKKFTLMRWSQAWMSYALSRLVQFEAIENEKPYATNK